jgi:DNA-binding MarR family transcriptional regulator
MARRRWPRQGKGAQKGENRMEHIGHLLKQIHVIMDNNFNSVVARYGLTTAQVDMLILLFRNNGKPMCQKEIESKLHLKNPTVTGTLKRLESKGFVKRVPLDSDRRYNQITPTSRALELDAELLGIIHRSEALMTEGFADEEREALTDALHRIIDNLTRQGG